MTRRMLTALAPAAAGFALAAAGCGGDSGSSATTTDAHASHTATPAPVTTPTAKPTPKPQVKTFTIVVEQAQPKGGIKTYTVKKGDRVAIVVRTDLGEAVHLHGYDIEKPVKAGRPTRIVFSATTPGRFVIELHNMDTVLGNLQVEP